MMQDVYKTLIGVAVACAVESVRQDWEIASYYRNECGMPPFTSTAMDALRSTLAFPMTAWQVYRNSSQLVKYSPEKGGFVPKGA